MTKYLFLLLALSIHSVNAATQKGFETEVYGFLRASSLYASDALASYNNNNHALVLIKKMVKLHKPIHCL